MSSINFWHHKLMKKKLDWIKKTIKEEYKKAIDKLDYCHFIEGKFSINEW